MEKFIDIPVKHYSSGMYMRLAFSIAINVDAEILLLDEILAVGDARFQRKCLDRVFEMKEAGKTILFVSHELSVVRSLCDRAVLIDHGRLVAEGDPQQVIDIYHGRLGSGSSSPSRIIPLSSSGPDTRSTPPSVRCDSTISAAASWNVRGGRADRRRGARHLA